MTNTSSAVALSQPLYGATFRQAVRRFFSKYGTFSGRASLSEFWWVALFTFLLSVVIVGVVYAVVYTTGVPREDGSIEYSYAGVAVSLVALLIALALVIPNIALTVRRLHDANFSGWFYLLSLLPSVGNIIILILTLMPSRAEGARFDK